MRVLRFRDIAAVWDKYTSVSLSVTLLFIAAASPIHRGVHPMPLESAFQDKRAAMLDRELKRLAPFRNLCFGN